MWPGIDRRKLREQRGLLRSVLIYHGIPWRHRQLVGFYRQFIGRRDLCFDVGAHVGNRIRAWRALDARVIGVEPQPACPRFLERWYGNDPDVTLVAQALGAGVGQSTLRISTATPTVTTLSQAWINAVQQTDSFAEVMWEQSASVDVTTLDRLIERFGMPTFCKIDVEGYELDVLRGLSRPLPALSVEYIPAAIDITLGCIGRLENLAQYEYNWSAGEEHRWQVESWIRADEIVAQMQALPKDGDSGDLYARCLDVKAMK